MKNYFTAAMLLLGSMTGINAAGYVGTCYGSVCEANADLSSIADEKTDCNFSTEVTAASDIKADCSTRHH